MSKGTSWNLIWRVSYLPLLVSNFIHNNSSVEPLNYRILNYRSMLEFFFLTSIYNYPILLHFFKQLQLPGKNLKKTNNWKRSLAVCTPSKIFLYDSEQDKTNKAFSLAIDINKVDSVRPMEHGELWRISAKNVPRLFRISFFSDDRTAADLDVSVVSNFSPRVHHHTFSFAPLCDR